MGLIPSRAILRRVRQADGEYTLSRLQVLEALPGNPVGVTTQRLDGAFAFRAKHLPVDSFNRVIGLTDSQIDEVPTLADWFSEAGCRGRFEIDPGGETTRLAGALARAGYFHSSFHLRVLFRQRTTGRPRQAPDSIDVEVVEEGRLEQFLDSYAAGWGVGEVEGFKNNVRGWLGQPGWTLYLGRHNGEAAGGAILYRKDGVAYCADSSVRPEMRGRGVHQALLHRRMADAYAAGCDLVCAKAAFLSTSHRNMVRAGLDLLCKPRRSGRRQREDLAGFADEAAKPGERAHQVRQGVGRPAADRRAADHQGLHRSADGPGFALRREPVHLRSRRAGDPGRAHHCPGRTRRRSRRAFLFPPVWRR